MTKNCVFDFFVGNVELIVFGSITIWVVVVMGFDYLKKRLESRQVLAAIEKGVPLSELVAIIQPRTRWIRYLSSGIGLIIAAIGIALTMWISSRYSLGQETLIILILVLILAYGISRVISSILYKKYPPKIG